jgi:hypothetical protein
MSRWDLIADLLHDLPEERLMAAIGKILQHLPPRYPGGQRLKLDVADDSREEWIRTFLHRLTVQQLKDFRKIVDGLQRKQ